MSAKLPNGNLTAQEIFLALAEPADADGFVDLHRLLAEMTRAAKEGTGAFPSGLRRDEAVSWGRLLLDCTDYALTDGPAIARVVGQRVELFRWEPGDEDMLAQLLFCLTRRERKCIEALDNNDRARLYWKAEELYQRDGFSHQGIEGLRQWARSRFRFWPPKLRLVGSIVGPGLSCLL